MAPTLSALLRLVTGALRRPVCEYGYTHIARQVKPHIFNMAVPKRLLSTRFRNSQMRIRESEPIRGSEPIGGTTNHGPQFVFSKEPPIPIKCLWVLLPGAWLGACIEARFHIISPNFRKPTEPAVENSIDPVENSIDPVSQMTQVWNAIRSAMWQSSS